MALGQLFSQGILQSGKRVNEVEKVGQVMKETKGSANPAAVNDAIKRVLGLS